MLRPLEDFQLDHKELKSTFDDEYSTYLKLKKWFKDKQIDKSKITIYSPGCGRDFATLLMVYDAIVSKNNKEVEIIFLDMRDFYDGIIFELEKYTKGVKIKQHKSKNCYKATAYFNDKKFSIKYYVCDASNYFPSELKKKIDIYYERAFEMFRAGDSMAAYTVFKNIKELGLVITDHSFDFASQKDSFKKLKRIPKKYGLYNNFQIWQKISN